MKKNLSSLTNNFTNCLKRKLIFVLIAINAFTSLFAQNTFPKTGAAGIGTTTHNASSLLDIVSTTKDYLFRV